MRRRAVKCVFYAVVAPCGFIFLPEPMWTLKPEGIKQMQTWGFWELCGSQHFLYPLFKLDSHCNQAFIYRQIQNNYTCTNVLINDAVPFKNTYFDSLKGNKVLIPKVFCYNQSQAAYAEKLKADFLISAQTQGTCSDNQSLNRVWYAPDDKWSNMDK